MPVYHVTFDLEQLGPRYEYLRHTLTAYDHLWYQPSAYYINTPYSAEQLCNHICQAGLEVGDTIHVSAIDFANFAVRTPPAMLDWLNARNTEMKQQLAFNDHFESLNPNSALSRNTGRLSNSDHMIELLGGSHS